MHSTNCQRYTYSPLSMSPDKEFSQPYHTHMLSPTVFRTPYQRSSQKESHQRNPKGIHITSRSPMAYMPAKHRFQESPKTARGKSYFYWPRQDAALRQQYQSRRQNQHYLRHLQQNLILKIKMWDDNLQRQRKQQRDLNKQIDFWSDAYQELKRERASLSTQVHIGTLILQMNELHKDYDSCLCQLDRYKNQCNLLRQKLRAQQAELDQTHKQYHLPKSQREHYQNQITKLKSNIKVLQENPKKDRQQITDQEKLVRSKTSDTKGRELESLAQQTCIGVAELMDYFRKILDSQVVSRDTEYDQLREHFERTSQLVANTFHKKATTLELGPLQQHLNQFDIKQYSLHPKPLSDNEKLGTQEQYSQMFYALVAQLEQSERSNLELTTENRELVVALVEIRAMV